MQLQALTLDGEWTERAVPAFFSNLLGALLIFLGLAAITSFLIATVVGLVAAWWIARAYKRAKRRLDNDWRG